MSLDEWIEAFQARCAESGYGCSRLYAAGHYRLDRDPVEASDRMMGNGFVFGHVVWRL